MWDYTTEKKIVECRITEINLKLKHVSSAPSLVVCHLWIFLHECAIIISWKFVMTAKPQGFFNCNINRSNNLCIRVWVLFISRREHGNTSMFHFLITDAILNFLIYSLILIVTRYIYSLFILTLYYIENLSLCNSQ